MEEISVIVPWNIDDDTAKGVQVHGHETIRRKISRLSCVRRLCIFGAMKIGTIYLRPYHSMLARQNLIDYLGIHCLY